MADEKRPSARQDPVGAPAKKDSNRTTAPATATTSKGSGRLTPAGKQPGTGHHAPVPGSKRQAAAAPPPPTPPPPAPSHSRRAGAAPVVKKQQPMPVKEIVIAGGVLLAILVLSLVIWKIRTDGIKGIKESEAAQEAIFKRNTDAVRAELLKSTKEWTLAKLEEVGNTIKNAADADKAKVTTTEKEKMFAAYKDNPKIYNVVFSRDFKDKRNTDGKNVQYLLSDDLEHQKINKLGNAKYTIDEQDLNISYGLTVDKSIPVVMATKILHPLKDDAINAGGKIMVVILAEEDDFLKNAIKRSLEGFKSGPADSTKPAETKPTAPAETKATAPVETKAPAAENKPEPKAP